MGFKYHPPTRCACEVCEKLLETNPAQPIISAEEGKASSANGYPFHDWYNFVLGFTPSFPEYMLNSEGITAKDHRIVLDPFNGSGTTQLVCKLRGVPSFGIDANDFMVFAAKQKLKWELNTNEISYYLNKILERSNVNYELIDWNDNNILHELANEDRPPALDARYISDKPLIKVKILKTAIMDLVNESLYLDFFMFAITSILVPVSNVKYGPGFGIGRQKDDANVIEIFANKVNLMMRDLDRVNKQQKDTFAETILGDSRKLSEYIENNSISLMITSPPYPGDHEYTKHSKLELIFQGYATDLVSFRTIKKRMIRGSTTNIYKGDNERRFIEDIEEIKQVTDEIDKRLKKDNATSGFEKLYTKLVWEYFGGMYMTLSECFKVLEPGGKIALLISDSHAFKMVHIQTALLLDKIGEKIGYQNSEIILWQLKNSTSHKYQLRENILILQKPN